MPGSWRCKHREWREAGPRGRTAMGKQQISKHAKAVAKGDSGAVGRPTRAGERQTRRRRPRAGAGAAEVPPVAAAAAVPEAIVDGSAISTGSGAPVRAVSQSRPKPKPAGAVGASDPDVP